MLIESGASDMALGWRREMDERSTDTGRAKAEEEIHCSVEVTFSLKTDPGQTKVHPYGPA